LGARRVAMELLPERATDSQPVTLRPAAMDDAQVIFEWQSAPETRRFARNPQLPALEEHLAWMAGRLKRQDSVFNIVLHGGVAAGVVRLDRIGREGLRFEVSIVTAPGRHGLGIGKAALRLSRRLLPEAEFLAHVLPQNTASCALFQSAGYVPDSDWFRSTPLAGHA
jgi:RimJ/RimL family protein N-acetyltransferase